MKLKAVLLALFVAGFAVSLAIAGNAPFAKKKSKLVVMCHLNGSKRPVTVLVKRTSVKAFIRRGYKLGACPKPRTITRTVTVTQPGSTVTTTVTVPATTTTTTTGSTTTSTSSTSSTTSSTTTTTTSSTSTTGSTSTSTSTAAA